jgi:hypothetical protein
MKKCVEIAQIPFPKPSASRTQTANLDSFTDQIPPNLETQYPLGHVFYAVEAKNSYQRSAGLSNQAQVAIAPTLAAPTNFRAQVSSKRNRISGDFQANIQGQ